MATYNVKWNKDDSVVRQIIIGLLADLNNKIYFYRQLGNGGTEIQPDGTVVQQPGRVEVDVPFYYAIAGDEDFLKDNFLFLTKDGLPLEIELNNLLASINVMENDDLVLYPNPSESFVNIGRHSVPVNWELYNSFGAIISSAS